MSEAIPTNTEALAPAVPPAPPGATAAAPTSIPTPAAAPPQPAPPQAAPEAPAFDPKSVSSGLWKAMDEDLRGWYEARGLSEETFDPLEVAKQRREVEKLVGRKGVPLPNGDPAADPTGWNQTWNALGVPKDPAGYEIKTDDPAQKEQAEAVAKLYHDAKLTPWQARRLTEGTVALMQQQEQAKAEQSTAAEVQRAETVKRETAELQREWGVDWDRKDQAAGRAIAGLGLDEDAVKAITREVGFKKMMQTMAAIGESTSEATFHGATGNSPAPAVSSQAGARAKVAQLSADQEFVARLQSSDRTVRAAALAEWEKYNRMAAGA